MKTINKLIRLEDRLIGKIHNHELQPIRTDNHYHSPKESETDEENDKRKIIVRDMRWRSSTVILFNQFFIFIFTNRYVMLI